MSYSFETLDEGHILILKMHEDFNIHTEIIQSALDAYKRLDDDSPDRVVLISDSRQIRVKSVNDLVQGATLASREESKRVGQHPKVLKNYSIVNNKLVQTAVKGLNTATFGYFEITIFETLEEAVRQARSVLAE